MNWKIKALIQNSIELLPSSSSYLVYYWIQRKLGGLRRFNPIKRLNAGIKTCKNIQNLGYTPKGKVFLEIGTGRVPIVPLAYWLMGAKKIITIDINPYLKTQLIKKSLNYISENKNEIISLFGSLINIDRFNKLLSFNNNSYITLIDFLDLCHIDYIAPGDATNIHLDDQSIDYHTSYTVLEHIPAKVLKDILTEGNRLIKDDGLFIHHIDYSDHFSHSDTNITSINFLQYSDEDWKKYTNNRYMYMNRLRHDDFIHLFESSNHEIVDIIPIKDKQIKEVLDNRNIQLHDKFSSKSKDIITITSAWILSKKYKHYT